MDLTASPDGTGNPSHRGYGDTFYLDEVFVKINGKQQYLRRAAGGGRWIRMGKWQ